MAEDEVEAVHACLQHGGRIDSPFLFVTRQGPTISRSQFLGISPRLLDLMKSRGDIPFIRVSRRKVMFSRSDLDAFMSARRIDVFEAKGS